MKRFALPMIMLNLSTLFIDPEVSNHSQIYSHRTSIPYILYIN